MRPTRTSRGTVIVPHRIDLDIGGRRVHGDGTREIGPAHPDFARWAEIADRYAAVATSPLGR
jgi:hypothetical protein